MKCDCIFLKLCRIWNDKFYFINFFFEKFYSFHNYDMRGSKNRESRRLQPNPAINIISQTPHPRKSFWVHTYVMFIFQKLKISYKEEHWIKYQIKVKLLMQSEFIVYMTTIWVYLGVPFKYIFRTPKIIWLWYAKYM